MKRPRLQKLDTNTLVMLKQIGWGLLVISLALLVLTGIWHGTRLHVLTVDEVLVQGGETINHQQVKEKVLQQLEGQYAGFVPRTFAWTYPKKDIVASLAEIDRIHSIVVARVKSHTLRVSFAEFLPAALWCQTLEAHECVFVDESGLAYSQAPDLTGGSLLRFVHTSREPELSQQLTSEADFLLLKQLAELLADNGWFVSHIEIDKARDAFLHIVDGGEFKVTLTQEPEVTVANLNVVLTSEQFTNIQPGNFQYIDLRFGNKVFVNEEPPIAKLEPYEDQVQREAEQLGAPETETATSDDAAVE